MKKNSMLFFLCCIFIAGCASVTPELTYDAVTPADEAIAVSPAQSLIPTKTFTPSPTLNLTRQAAEMVIESTRIVQTAQSVHDASRLETLKSQFSGICESDNLSLSPNENWLAQDCFLERKLLVSSRESSRAIVIPYQEMVKLTGETMAISNVQPLFWTKDGRYLFFTQHICCIDTDAFGWDGALFRLNLNTGEWNMLVSGYFNYFSFSPLGDLLVHIPDDLAGGGTPIILNVINMQTWSQKTILLNEYEQAGSLVWSPDESGFALASKIGNYYSGGEVFFVIVVDLRSASSKIIFTQASRFIGPVDWSLDNVITLVESCNQLQIYDCANQFMFYDLNSETFR